MSDADRYRTLLEALNRGVEGVDVPPREEAAPGEGAEGRGRGRPGPTLFVTGAPRSGTTLLYQLLCATGVLGYVSNVVARFYRNPAFGAGVQELLRPLLPREPMRYESEYGRTGAWHEPHEFGFFWARHLPFEESHEPPGEELEAVGWSVLDAELAALARALGRPLVLKNNILACVTPALARNLPGSVFVEVRRDPVDVAHSVLRAREEEAGAPRSWWSTRVRDWRGLEARPPAEQIVAQIAAVDAAHEGARREAGEERWMVVRYAQVCADPRGVAGRILERFGLPSVPDAGRLPEGFRPSVAERGSAPELADLERLLAERGVRRNG